MATDYKIEFRDVNDGFWRVWIKDTTGGYNTTVALTPGSASPLILRAVNNEEDKLTPLRGREATITYLNEGSNGIAIFNTSGGDNRWKVEVEYTPNGGSQGTEFVGYLQLDDMEEPLKPANNLVTLTASDMLGRLKDVHVKNAVGETFYGQQPLIKYIAWALAGTGLALDINVCSSTVISTDSGDRAFFEYAHTHGETFNGLAIESDRCYAVLEKILSPRFFLCQANGAWFIMDIDDMDGASMSWRQYSSSGSFISSGSFNLWQTIPYFIQSAAEQTLQRPVKYVKLAYSAEVGNLLLNQDYRKGAVNGVGYTPPAGLMWGDPDSDIYATMYTAEGWTLQQVNRSTGALSSANAWARIRREFYFGSEWMRCLDVFKEDTENTWNDYILENNAKVPVRKGDKVSFSMEVAFPWPGVIKLTPYDTAVCQVLLFTNDGEVFTLIAENADQYPNAWKKVTTGSAYNKEYYWRVKGVKSITRLDYYYGDPASSIYGTKEWATINNEGKNHGSEPVPTDGILKVRLCHFTSEYEKGVIDMNPTPRFNKAPHAFFRNIKLEIKSLNGFMTRNTYGWFWKGEQTGIYNNINEKELAVQNGTAYIHDGCLVQIDSNPNNQYGYKQINQVKSKNATLNEWGALAARAVWNQCNRVFQTIRGGFFSTVKPALNGIYSITGVANKRYLLLGADWDARMAQVSNAVLKEVYDSSIGKEAKTIIREIEEPK